MHLSKVWQVSLVSLVVVLLFVTGTWAATVKQLSTSTGMSMKITGFDTNPEQGFEGFEVDLRIYTPAFTGSIWVPGLHSSVIVVQNGVVIASSTTQGSTLPSAPAIPADGFVVVGSGLASTNFLPRFPVGTEVKIVEKESKAMVPAPQFVITLSGGAKEVSAVDRGRKAYELVVYTPDFGSHSYTNGYGAEVVVIDGIITKKRGYGDTELWAIPENGYILSGHNIMGTWLFNLPLGDLVELQ